MKDIRRTVAAALLGSLALSLSAPASAHGGGGWGHEGWEERHHRHHRHAPQGSRWGGYGYTYAPAPVYAAPPVVVDRPVVYRPAPVYAYPAAPAITIGLPPLVIPLR